MNDAFTEADPREVVAALVQVSGRVGDGLVIRMAVSDSTDAEQVEIDCLLAGSTWCSHRCRPEDLEEELARYLNLTWPPAHRLSAVRIRAAIGGQYFFGGDWARGLQVNEPPVTLAA